MGDTQEIATTAKQCKMKNCAAVTFVLLKGKYADGSTGYRISPKSIRPLHLGFKSKGKGKKLVKFAAAGAVAAVTVAGAALFGSDHGFSSGFGFLGSSVESAEAVEKVQTAAAAAAHAAS